jgi:hypothetical protein
MDNRIQAVQVFPVVENFPPQRLAINPARAIQNVRTERFDNPPMGTPLAVRETDAPDDRVQDFSTHSGQMIPTVLFPIQSGP